MLTDSLAASPAFYHGEASIDEVCVADGEHWLQHTDVWETWRVECKKRTKRERERRGEERERGKRKEERGKRERRQRKEETGNESSVFGILVDGAKREEPPEQQPIRQQQHRERSQPSRAAASKKKNKKEKKNVWNYPAAFTQFPCPNVDFQFNTETSIYSLIILLGLIFSPWKNQSAGRGKCSELSGSFLIYFPARKQIWIPIFLSFPFGRPTFICLFLSKIMNSFNLINSS